MTTSQLLILLAIGFAAGTLSGIFGVGGGIIIIPALVFILGMSQHNAQGTSMAVLVFPAGILALVHYYKQGHVNLKFALVLIAAFVVGGYVGSLFATQISGTILKRAFGVLILIVGIKMVFGK